MQVLIKDPVRILLVEAQRPGCLTVGAGPTTWCGEAEARASRRGSEERRPEPEVRSELRTPAGVTVAAVGPEVEPTTRPNAIFTDLGCCGCRGERPTMPILGAGEVEARRMAAFLMAAEPSVLPEGEADGIGPPCDAPCGEGLAVAGCRAAAGVGILLEDAVAVDGGVSCSDE